jgi:DNA repair protein RecN (Recombination protein N)
MIRYLRISGFAVIDEVELPLGPGLTVITGETGAGKSVLVEALALLRGGRARAEVIRSGRDEAQVEAIFDLPVGAPVRERLAAEGRSVDEGLVVRRIVSRAGRGRVQLGGGIATASELAAAVGGIVDITSQHDQQSLMSPESQLSILDAFAENTDLLDRCRCAWERLSHLKAEHAGFAADARTRAEREDFLRFQLTELDEAALAPGEDQALKAERERIRAAEKFLSAFSRGEETLYSGETAAAGLIAAVVRELEALASLDQGLTCLGERLRSAQSLVEDVAREIGRMAGQVRFDPERLSEIEERLYLIARLCRKHGGTVDSVIARREEIARELAGLASFEAGLEARGAAVKEATSHMEAICATLSERRCKAARTLGKRIDQTLRDLELSRARVDVEIESRGEPGPRGADRVRFLFAPNPGEDPKPLARIASGGELSRVMLAVKQALAQADPAFCYVFDEVDSGVGGGTAEVIGRKLKALSGDRQVLAVTHLPQIAAFADHHIRVEKETTRGRTTARAEALDSRARAAELARMLGGARPSREAAAHADEMLRRARG